MQWMRFQYQGKSHFGVRKGDHVQPHAGALFGDKHPNGEPVPLADITWLPPCQPRLMLALWNNFHAAAQKNGWAIPTEPLYFVKTANAHAAHEQAIAAPTSYDGRVAFEGELAIVIGRETRRISASDASAHIFGYTCANDLTALELLHRDPAFAQWTRAKNFDGFGPFGPVIDTDLDPAQAELRTVVGGRERQRYALSDMIFAPHELVARLSQDLTLQAGDVILCGTSLGVLPMKPGTRVEVSIDGIGTLANVYG